MTQMNTAAVRVIDPILSTIAQGFKNADMAYHSLFPVVPVGQRGGKVLQFGKEDFRLYNTGRAPGGNVTEVQYGYAGVPFALSDYSLAGKVPIEHQEEAEAVPGINLGEGAVQMVENIFQLQNEFAAAQLATTATNYGAGNKVTLSGTSQWSDYSGTSDPTADVDNAVEAIRSVVGKRPNVMVIGPKVWKALKRHPKLIDRIKYTSRDSLTTQMVAALFDIPNLIVGEAIYADASDAFTDVWGKFAVLAFTQLGTIHSRGLPSYGYTYRLNGYPMVEQPYYRREVRSWLYPTHDALQPVIASANSGFLISGAVA